jgi:hypothetical protein
LRGELEEGAALARSTGRRRHRPDLVEGVGARQDWWNAAPEEEERDGGGGGRERDGGVL